MTDRGRKQQVEKALAARAEKPAAEQHSHPLPWRGTERYFPVVELPLDVPLLNAESHRIRAQLELPEYEFVRKERTSQRAQEVLAELWTGAHRKFEKLKESLGAEGQTEPGVITREGVVINGNTRLVALAQLPNASQRFFKCAVLDTDARPAELAQLELRLQVRDPLLDPYKLSNELLFIEEMAREYRMSEEEIAASLDWSPARPAVGARKVQLYRRILALVREMQRRNPRLPVTFFDDKLQQLKELEQKYRELVGDGELERADELLGAWVVVGRSGFSNVHAIRSVTRTESFVEDYLLPRLSEHEMFAGSVDALLPPRQGKVHDLPGIDELGVGGDENGGRTAYDLKPLIRIVEKDDHKKVSLPGADGGPVEAGQVKGALREAINGAIKDRQAEGKAEDALNAPVDALRKAARDLKQAIGTYSELRGTKEFERSTRGTFEYQFRQVRKHVKTLEELITGKEGTQRGK